MPRTLISQYGYSDIWLLLIITEYITICGYFQDNGFSVGASLGGSIFACHYVAPGHLKVIAHHVGELHIKSLVIFAPVPHRFK